MSNVAFSFRPMPNLSAELLEASVFTHGAFVCIDAIPGHPIYVSPHVVLNLAAALKAAYHETRESASEVLR